MTDLLVAADRVRQMVESHRNLRPDYLFSHKCVYAPEGWWCAHCKLRGDDLHTTPCRVGGGHDDPYRH
jgi:hypothetical protein